MFFYVDESGHSGSKLFSDPKQPVQYYGVLSSTQNIDVLAKDAVQEMRNILGIPRLHATDMQNVGLARIAPQLIKLQKELDLRFAFYRINKSDYSVISFFDQVFDSGINDAVPHSVYNTPLRYAVLLCVAEIFDDELRKKAWAARINPVPEVAHNELVSVCTELLKRTSTISNKRGRETVRNALKWAISNPEKIQYNVDDEYGADAIAPNAIGFQPVMFGIASLLKDVQTNEVVITVDRQGQFNKHQKKIAEYYAMLKGQKIPMGPNMPELDCTGIPDVPLDFRSSENSSGLELVDTYLWLFKRLIEKKGIAPELSEFIKWQMQHATTDDISLNGIVERWSEWWDERYKTAF